MFSWILQKAARALSSGCKVCASRLDAFSSRIEYRVPGIVRFKCRNEVDLFNRPRWWSVYGFVGKDGEKCAVVHWQGWEDAGWKVIPVAEFTGIEYARPDPSETEFYVLTPPYNIHRFGETGADRSSPKKTIHGFKWSNGKLYASADLQGDWIDVELLYDVKDPQFYPHYII